MELPEPATGSQWTASTETALCLIPPREAWERLDRFRSLYDKAYGKWPPHINLVYPFVQPERIDEAVRLLGGLDLRFLEDGTLPVALEEADCFVHKHSNSIHIRPGRQGKDHHLKAVVNAIRGALGWDLDEGFQPHLTLGQSQHKADTAQHLSLLSKARLLTPLAWNADQISILIRTRHDTAEPGDVFAQRDMRLWGSVAMPSAMPTQLPALEIFYPVEREEASPNYSKQAPRVTHHFTGTSWSPMSESRVSGLDANERVDRLVIASYNVLADFEGPPNHSRYSALISNLLSIRASADILVLEEVTDDFLAALLANEQICSKYPYATHGPPNLQNIGHLPNHLNIVVLSRFCFTWGYLASHRKHKGFVLAQFSSLMDCGDVTDKRPLVVAACHLTRGLVDSAVAAKKSELRKLLSHLSTEFPDSPCVVAGDFNLPTSTYTIDAAREKQNISAHSREYLESIDSILADAHLRDAWLVSRIESGESSSIGQRQRPMLELYEGEEGATFDPGSNKLAEKLTGSGLGNRPQRYDRILVNDHLQLRPRRFNLFGAEVSGVDGMPPSDHWGIRCLLERPNASMSVMSSGSQTTIRPIQPRRAASSLGGMGELKSCLSRCPGFPTDEATDTRAQAIRILEKILQCRSQHESEVGQTKGPILILVPVGSFGLGVWDDLSDVDCLCIGEISSDVFFKLAVSRLRKATAEGVSILRRVRATSGTMLQLNIGGVVFDLQYCCAASIAKGFPQVMNRPASDPVFALAPSTLAKLKPLRDLYYIRRSIPDMAQYRTAHLLIKEWARLRGVYGAKFGLLGGIHILVLLAPVCKALAQSGASYSVSDIVVTFFHHYAQMDWASEAAFDPFFHRDLHYHRTFREPLCLLGWHAPYLNTAANASKPTVETMAREFNRAAAILSKGDVSWDGFLEKEAELWPASRNGNEKRLGRAVTDFLCEHDSYIKIDLHHWGSSLTKGRRFTGWLESRLVTLLVDIDRKVSSLGARIWPQRFSDRGVDEGEKEFHGHYLVGVYESQGASSGQASISPANSRSWEALEEVLRQFEARHRGIARYFDANTSWLSARLVRRDELGVMVVDERQFGDMTGAESEDDETDTEDEEHDDDNDDNDDNNNNTEEGMDRLKSLKDEKSRTPRPSEAARLRSASDVMNRIRWDPAMDAGDYLVGYEDRFSGLRERPLEQWKREQTDEEFIPQHRIQYFKRRSDATLVWERGARRDDIFGSGISARTTPPAVHEE